MSELQQPHFYFSEAEILQRVFIVYGNLSDYYITPGRCRYSFDRAVSAHLKHMGYKVVIIVNGTETMECPDEESAKLRREKIPTQREVAADRKRNSAAGSGTEAGTTESAPPAVPSVRDRFRRQTTAPSRPSEPEKAPLRFTENADHLVEYLDQAMRNTAVRTAIVFCNSSAFLDERADRSKSGLDATSLASRMSLWYGLPAENENIAVMLFNLPRIVTLHDALMNQRRWNFLFERAFNDDKATEAVIRIGSPRMDEIRYMLQDSVPAYVSHAALRELDPSYTRQGLEDAANYLVQQNHGSLKSLKLFFRQHPHDAVRMMMEKYSAGHQDALEALRREGWEPVYEKISSIIEENRNAIEENSTQELPIFPDTNLRMAHDQGMSATNANLSLILVGSPGTGKTTVVQHIASAFRQCGLLPSSRVTKVTRADLVAGYVGQTAIRTSSAINDAMGGVLFVDEAYTLYRESHENSNDFGQEAIDTLMEAVSDRRGEISIILAGYPEEMRHFLTANPGLPRRFEGNIIHIPDYKPDLLERIFLRYIGTSNRLSMDDSILENIRFLIGGQLAGLPDGSADPDEYAEQSRKEREEDRLSPLSVFFDNWYADRNTSDFGNAGACETLAVQVMGRAKERVDIDDGDIAITQEDFDEKQQKYFINRKPSVEELERQLEDVVGMDKVKDKLRTIVSYLRTAQMRTAMRKDKSLAPEPGHYLFVGNPGTGKTLISEKLGMALCSMGMIERYHPVRRTGLDLINTVAGHSDGIKSLKQELESYNRGVLVVDEAHQLCDTGPGGAGSAVIKCLLDPMIEHAKEFCVVFCCYPDQMKRLLELEQGLKRRITDVFTFEDYEPEEICDIFRMKAEKRGYILSEEVLEAALKVFRVMKESPGGSLLENGGSAEKMLHEMEISIALRLKDDLSDVRKPSDITGQDPELQRRLFIVEPVDILQAGDRIIATQTAKNGGFM